MSSKIKILQVIPRLGYGGAETGCYDLAHYLSENGCSSYIVTSGGELIKYIDKKKVKLIKLPVHSKNPLLILINSLILILVILFFKTSVSLPRLKQWAPITVSSQRWFFFKPFGWDLSGGEWVWVLPPFSDGFLEIAISPSF